MVIKIRKMLLLLFLMTALAFLGGCWDIREINELGLVTAVGVDKAEGQNKYSVTVQVANPSSEGSGGDNGGAKNEVWIGTEEGASLFDAVRKLVNISSRRIMWAHNNVVIIGESMAKEGITPIIDYFTHNPELRLKAVVVVANGDAKEYITAKAGMESPSGVSFVSMESYRALTGESVKSNMLKVSADLQNKYSHNLIAGIRLKKAIIQSTDGESKGKSSETIELAGAAVFERDKMLGWISPQECRGISWILNQTKNTVVTVTDPEYGNKGVVVETKGVKAKIKTDVIEGMPRISIHISGAGTIVEEDGSTDKRMSEVKENVAALIDEKIEDEIKRSLKVIQEKYEVDCIGLAAFVHAQNDAEWESGLKDQWQEIFPQIPVTVSVAINIDTSSLNQEPMNIY